jgi:hypothetical protein
MCTNIFYSVSYFSLLIVFFGTQKLLIFMKSNLFFSLYLLVSFFIFETGSQDADVYPKKKLSKKNAQI